jgi:hypothetical protein
VAARVSLELFFSGGFGLRFVPLVEEPTVLTWWPSAADVITFQ